MVCVIHLGIWKLPEQRTLFFLYVLFYCTPFYLYWGKQRKFTLQKVGNYISEMQHVNGALR